MKDGGIIAVTLGKLGKSDKSSSDEPMSYGKGKADEGPDESTGSMAFLSAADELFDALKADDKGAFSEKLKNAISACIQDYEDSEGDDAEKKSGGDDGGGY